MDRAIVKAITITHCLACSVRIPLIDRSAPAWAVLVILASAMNLMTSTGCGTTTCQDLRNCQVYETDAGSRDGALRDSAGEHDSHEHYLDAKETDGSPDLGLHNVDGDVSIIQDTSEPATREAGDAPMRSDGPDQPDASS